MKRNRYSEEEIVKILREGQGEIGVKALCAKHNISEPTYYKWKQKYGGMEVNELKKMRGLNEENSRLKRIVAEQAIQIDILKAVSGKKW